MARKPNLEATIESNRPPTSAGRLDQSLAGLALALRGVVAETQEMFIYPACQLDNDSLDELAVALVEFAEDIHAGIGLWQALENYQSEFFGTPLPLFLDVGEPLSGRFDPRRVRHFLYILWRQLKPDLILAPDHRDLTELAETLSEFLAAAFRQQPKDSGVARFLHTPNRRGWDVKRKLVWAGQHSYLFHQCARSRTFSTLGRSYLLCFPKAPEETSMNKFIAILGLALIPVLSPLTGQAQQSKSAVTAKSVSALHRSHFTIGKLSTREERNRTYVDGEITSNAKKEASTVFISVRWFDKNDHVVAKERTYVSDLAPGETLPFHADTKKNPEITRYDVTVESTH